MNRLFPIATFDEVDIALANQCLRVWTHKMGELNRPFPSRAYALFDGSQPICVATHGPLITPHAGGGLGHITRDNAIELSRLCAIRPGLCRVGIRLWRELVFPNLGCEYAMSYQDADLHNGNTYRFDGWQRLGYSRSGTDQRSGRKGRNKWIWVWRRREAVAVAA